MPMYYLKGSSNADANTCCFLYKATNIRFKVVNPHVSSERSGHTSAQGKWTFQ